MPPKTRRPKSTGALYQRCDTTRGCPQLAAGPTDPLTGNPTRIRPKHTCRGPWVAAVTLPSRDGKRRRKVIVRAKKSDALNELRKVRDQLERAGDLGTSSPTLSAWLDVWWKRYGMKTLKVSTRPVYKSRIEQYIRPCLGHLRLDQMRPEHIHQLHDFVTDRDLSVTTARGTHVVLSRVLGDALTEDKVTRNLCQVVKPPKPAVVTEPYLDGSQSRHLMQVHDPDDGTVPLGLASWIVALMTGMRQAERLGLTADHIDFDQKVITVAWQLRRLAFDHGCGDKTEGRFPCGRRKGGYCPSRRLSIPADQEVRHVEGGLYLTRPKTKAGWRRVPMYGPLEWALRTYMDANEPGINGLIFTRPGGRPIDPSADSKAWAAALQAAGLPHVKGHSCRHSANTILDELGVPQDVRMLIVGHSSKAANQIYTHITDSRTVDAMQKLTGELDWRR